MSGRTGPATRDTVRAARSALRARSARPVSPGPPAPPGRPMTAERTPRTTSAPDQISGCSRITEAARDHGPSPAGGPDSAASSPASAAQSQTTRMRAIYLPAPRAWPARSGGPGPPHQPAPSDPARPTRPLRRAGAGPETCEGPVRLEGREVDGALTTFACSACRRRGFSGKESWEVPWHAGHTPGRTAPTKAALR